MTPISQLVEAHPELVSKLHRFSFAESAHLVGTLGLMPELLANTIRVEVLIHLVAVCCRGHAKPKPKDLADWIGKLMADSPVARLEDPVEDLFIGCVNSHFGSFRIFQGNFGDGAFIVERLLDFYSEKANFPTFQQTIDSVLSLLRLSEALAQRVNLPRYTAGSGYPGERIQLPRWRDLEPKANSIFFAHEELQSLGISRESLSNFCLSKEHRTNIAQEVLWSSSLERHPLVEIEKGVLAIEPSTFSRTAVRFMVEQMRVAGGWGEFFYQMENASIFVNDVSSSLQIEPIDFSRPAAGEGTPSMFPWFGAFDLGKPVMMLTYTPPLAGTADSFADIDKLAPDEQSKFQRYVEACAAELEKMPNFSGGMVLVSIAGYGRGGAIGLAEWSPKWRVHFASLRDWLALSADGGFTAMRLWKLGEHDAARERLGIKLLNPSDLLNLVAYWEQSGFRLVPRETDIHQERKLIVLECDFAQSIRVAGTQKRDEHCVQSPDKQSWVRVVRHNSRTFLPDDRDAPIYAAIDEARKRLIGYIIQSRSHWWVTTQDRPERAELRNLLFQLWECVLNWANQLAAVADREWPILCDRSVAVHLDLPDFARWDYGRAGMRPLQCGELSVRIDQRSNTITITIPEGFLRYFNVAKNVAEQRIVAAMISGASQLAGDLVAPEQIELLSRAVMQNEDARYFHVVETREIEQLLGASNRPRPHFVADEDMMLSELGLADLAGRPNQDGVVIGEEGCRAFLQEIVTKVWERIEERLQAFDRRSIVSVCFQALDEIARDAAHWNLTTRSLLALRKDEGETKSILRHRRSQWDEANLANRLLIETAQYACTSSGGLPLTMADHSSLLAEMSLLITFASHRDGIAFGFLKPEVIIYPNGEVEVDDQFYSETFSRYLSHRSDNASGRAAEEYEKHFETHEPLTDKKSREVDDRIAKLNEVFEPEFGFPVVKLIKVIEVWRDFALHSNSSTGELTEPEILSLLCQGCEFSAEEANAFLDRLTLPIRAAWDADFPARCKEQDVYPWRFRRNLSLLVRPLVQVRDSPRTWIISASFFEKSVAYLTGNIENADFPARFFASEGMRKYVGQQVNRRGHAFAERVFQAFNTEGLSARLEIEMTELGVPKKEGLGDIDVLAWNATKGQVYAIECKRLLPAMTVREVIQRLEDFLGDRKVKDSLARHLGRIEWLKRHPASLTKLTGIPVGKIQLLPLLVTSDIVPMQFFKGMDFPSEFVVPLDELPRLFKCQ